MNFLTREMKGNYPGITTNTLWLWV